MPGVQTAISSVAFSAGCEKVNPGKTSRGTTHAYWQTMRSHPTPALPIYLRERDVCNAMIRDQVSQHAAHDGHYGRSTPPSPHVVSDRL